jgi:hypothetical protein
MTIMIKQTQHLMSRFFRRDQRTQLQIDRINSFLEYCIRYVCSNEWTKNFSIRIEIDSTRRNTNSLCLIRCALESVWSVWRVKCFYKSFRLSNNIERIIKRIFKIVIEWDKIVNIETSEARVKMMFKQFKIILRIILKFSSDESFTSNKSFSLKLSESDESKTFSTIEFFSKKEIMTNFEYISKCRILLTDERMNC